MQTVLDGVSCADTILQQLKQQREILPTKTRLGIVLVGDNPASLSYIKQKQNFGEHIDISAELFQFNTTISTKKLRHEVGRINRMANMRGVIVQMPLPKTLNTQSILNAVLPDKDIDALSATMSGKIYTNTYTILPPTVASIMYMLEQYNIDIKSKIIALVGVGRLIGKPLSLVLSHKGATLMLINKHTQDPAQFTQQADIIISGTGTPHHIMPDMIQHNTVLIDAGYEIKNKKILGDIHPDCYEKALHYTPVPNGIGALTVAMLYNNLFTLILHKQ